MDKNGMSRRPDTGNSGKHSINGAGANGPAGGNPPDGTPGPGGDSHGHSHAEPTETTAPVAAPVAAPAPAPASAPATAPANAPVIEYHPDEPISVVELHRRKAQEKDAARRDIKAQSERVITKVKGLPTPLRFTLYSITALLILTVGLTSWALSGGGERKPVNVYISRGSGVSDIADTLKEKGVLRSKTAFLVGVKTSGVANKLQAGEYQLTTGLSMSQLVEEMKSGPDTPAGRLTFPEGLTLREMAERISDGSAGSKLTMGSASFLTATSSAKDFRSEYPFLPTDKSASLEGYLFPDTYETLENIPPKDLIRTFLDRFGQVRSGFDWDTLPMDLTPHEVVIVASLIEKEAKVDSERPMIASVIYNRLAKKQRLQIDATVQYALPERKQKLSRDDLFVESPYNTYRKAGLPPGPIANPGKASIAAAIKPAETDNLYYVLKDSAGHHEFTVTYEDFLKAKESYLGD